MNEADFITTEELARRTGLTPQFWIKRRITGKSPSYVKIGRKVVRYSWNEIEKWLLTQQINPKKG